MIILKNNLGKSLGPPNLEFVNRALRGLENLDGELEDDVDAGELEEEHQDERDDERDDHRAGPQIPDPDLKRTSRKEL